jgi:NADPH:quinone reductase-like Zn-dependent oxidoreductase
MPYQENQAMSSMKAVRIHNYGGADKLVLEDAPRPVAAQGEVLIRVHATSANPFDCAARAGYMAGWYTYAFPLILGLDVSGVVEAVGDGVTQFKPGDAVFARTDPARNGAYAEYVAVAASEVAIKPPSLDHVHAAALPHAGLTAWRALVDAANLSAGQTILIHGAAGGVGSLAVQLAKARGAKVIATASSGNVEFLKSLGADVVVDYTSTRFEDFARGVDVVLDTIGGETQERSWPVLKPGGILLSLVQPPSQDTATAHGVRQQMAGGHPPAGSVLTEIAGLVKSGQVKPIISLVLPLHEMQQAHSLVEGKHTRGKVAIRVIE